MTKIFFSFLVLAIFPGALTFAPHYNLDVLKNLTEAKNIKIQEIAKVLGETPKSYIDMIADRFECLQWECVVQEQNVNRSSIGAVGHGLAKSKKLANFQCISSKTRDALDKLNARCSSVSQNSDAVLENGLRSVMQFELLIPGFKQYVEGLYEAKKEELSKTNKEDAIKKILTDVENKMEFLGAVLEQISAQIETLKSNFFEVYVNFAHAEETALRKIQREGSQNILKCII